MNKTFTRGALGALVAGGALAANAGGPDFSTLTAAVDFGTVGIAILALAALMMAPKIIVYGVKKVLSFVRG